MWFKVPKRRGVISTNPHEAAIEFVMNATQQYAPQQPYDEGHAYFRLHEQGQTIHQIAALAVVSISTVRRRINYYLHVRNTGEEPTG